MPVVGGWVCGWVEEEKEEKEEEEEEEEERGGLTCLGPRLGNEVLLGDGKLLGKVVARETDDFHAVLQRTWDGVHLVERVGGWVGGVEEEQGVGTRCCGAWKVGGWVGGWVGGTYLPGWPCR